MAGEHDTTAAAPGSQSPGGEPAGEPEAPVTPTAPVEEPATEQPGPAPAEDPGPQPVPAGDPEAPTGPATTAAPGATNAARGTAAAPGTPAATANGSGPTAQDDHERMLERDLEELTAKAEKADEYLELAKRTKADFENYRKRAAREAAAAQERGVAKLAKELLPAVDNLDRAVEAATSGEHHDETLTEGIKLVHADVLAALQRAGIEPYTPKGEPFDPQRHEALAQHPVEGVAAGTIVEVYQRGYLLGEAVIRPARVVVAG